MKHFRFLLPLLVLALALSGCGNRRQEPYEYTFSLDNQVKTIKINPETQTILDGTDVYTYEMEKTASGISYVIDYPNGAIYQWIESKNGGAGGWSESYDDTAYIPGNILVYALEENQPREKIGNVGIGLLLMGLGALNFFLPEIPFYLKYGWRFRDEEPSEVYLTLTRIGGALVAILGLIQFFV